MIGRLIARALIPLTIIASVIAASPWLRAFPSSVVAIPLFGAALLSVLVPVLVSASGFRRLWQSTLAGVAVWLVFELVVVLHQPLGFADLASGLIHGPSRLLSFALPLVSPRSLMVAPVTLAWLGGGIGGECVARRWNNAFPYLTWLVVLGLGIAGTERAATSAHADHLVNLLLGAGLLVVMLLLRSASSWVQQAEGASAAGIEGRLPLRGIGYGLLAALAVSALAVTVVQAPVFTARSIAPERVPPVRKSDPLSPVAFIASLRPASHTSPGRNVFTVTLNSTAPAYVPIANVDLYSGDGWSFQRTFRPSGGIVGAETDPSLTRDQQRVEQSYDIDGGPLAGTPWMPAMERVRTVTGLSVNVDAGSAMVVPTASLHGGSRYRVSSSVSSTPFSQIPATNLAATSTPPIDVQLPAELRQSLAELVQSFAADIGVDPSTNPLAFLLALQRDFQRNYALYQAGSSTPSSSSSSPKSPRRGTPSATSSATSSAASGERAGSTSYADVLASIVSSTRTASPEQYATMFALIARELGIPARVVTGFRLSTGTNASATVPPGTYQVTTAEAWTWVELPIRDHGWLIADVSPGSYSSARQSDSAGVQPSSSTPPTQGIALSQGPAGHAVAPKSKTAKSSHPARDSVWTFVLLAVLTLALLVAAVLGLLLLRKRRRRLARLRAPDPRRRLLGAWRESLDTFSEAGLSELTALTSAEVAARSRERFGPVVGQQTGELGARANEAMYSGQVSISSADAEHAWSLQREMRREVHRQLDLRSRISASLAFHRAAAGPIAGPGSWQEDPDQPAGRRSGNRPPERPASRRGAGRHGAGRHGAARRGAGRGNGGRRGAGQGDAEGWRAD